MEKMHFAKTRNRKLITPCCGKNNKDGKFVNFKDFEDKLFGFCHSCGSTTLPNNGLKNYYSSKFEYPNFQETNFKEKLPKQKYIHEAEIQKQNNSNKQNNLKNYLIRNYEKINVDRALEYYLLGTDLKGGTIFWFINKEGKIQKSKVCYYNQNGKRTDKFYVPYKNKDGYLFCLFGEHLIIDEDRGKRTLILVESEKTAIVGEIMFSEYTWLAYSGINGLTDEKIKALKGHRVVIIPDLSSNAVQIIKNKLPLLSETCLFVNIIDLREGKSDDQLRKEGIYNDDLEDFIMKIITKTL